MKFKLYICVHCKWLFARRKVACCPRCYFGVYGANVILGPRMYYKLFTQWVTNKHDCKVLECFKGRLQDLRSNNKQL